MAALYLFALLVGGALLAIGAFGGHGHGGDLDHQLDAGDHDSHGGAEILSLRTLTYLCFVFGGIGSALSWAWKGASPLLVFALALVAGVGVAAVVAFTFRYLKQTSSGDTVGEDSFVGLPARVVLPFGDSGVGKVMVRRGDRSFELLARPMDEQTATTDSWKSVVVVEMRRGTALVAPLDEVVMPETP